MCGLCWVEALQRPSCFLEVAGRVGDVIVAGFLSLGSTGEQRTLGIPRRVPMLHELFRGQRESTYILPYSFVTEDGQTESGRLWICGCARTHLPAKSSEWILYDPEQPGRNLPLRVAVMVAPH